LQANHRHPSPAWLGRHQPHRLCRYAQAPTGLQVPVLIFAPSFRKLLQKPPPGLFLFSRDLTGQNQQVSPICHQHLSPLLAMSADCLFFIWRAQSRSSSAVPSVASPSGGACTILKWQKESSPPLLRTQATVAAERCGIVARGLARVWWLARRGAEPRIEPGPLASLGAGAILRALLYQVSTTMLRWSTGSAVASAGAGGGDGQ
jgi:hypothetical protein